MTEEEQKNSELGLGIVLRVFQYIIDDQLAINGEEPKAAKMTPSEIFNFFRLVATTTSRPEDVYRIAKSIRKDLFPSSNIGKCRKYKRAFEAAFRFAQHYKTAFESS